MNTYDDNLDKLSQEELQEHFKEKFVKECVAKYHKFKDIFDPYLVTNEVDKIPFEEWEYVIARMKHDAIVLTEEKKKNKTFTHVHIFEIYDIDKLAYFYSINCVPAITEYFINEIKRKAVKGTVEPFINLSGWGSHYKSKYENEAFEYRLASNTADKKLREEKQRYDSEYEKLKVKRQACLAISEILMDEKEQPELFEFVCNALQYASLDDLNKLMQMYRSGFKEIKKGRPNKNEPKKIIIMYNKEGEIENRFENRQTCIKMLGIPKALLSQILSGKKNHWKGYRFKEQITEEQD